jgi:hypothetical protein
MVIMFNSWKNGGADADSDHATHEQHMQYGDERTHAPEAEPKDRPTSSCGYEQRHRMSDRMMAESSPTYAVRPGHEHFGLRTIPSGEHSLKEVVHTSHHVLRSVRTEVGLIRDREDEMHGVVGRGERECIFDAGRAQLAKRGAQHTERVDFQSKCSSRIEPALNRAMDFAMRS